MYTCKMECVCLYKIFYSKENVSLQNGCAYTRGLYYMRVHARLCFFFFVQRLKTGKALVTLILMMIMMIMMFIYVL